MLEPLWKVEFVRRRALVVFMRIQIHIYVLLPALLGDMEIQQPIPVSRPAQLTTLEIPLVIVKMLVLPYELTISA